MMGVHNVRTIAAMMERLPLYSEEQLRSVLAEAAFQRSTERRRETRAHLRVAMLMNVIGTAVSEELRDRGDTGRQPTTPRVDEQRRWEITASEMRYLAGLVHKQVELGRGLGVETRDREELRDKLQEMADVRVPIPTHGAADVCQNSGEKEQATP